MRTAILLLLAAGMIPAEGSADTPLQRLKDPSFEKTPPGKLETSADGQGWEVQRVGRPKVQDRLRAECVKDKSLARDGEHVIKLSLPKDTVGFEFVTVGQRLQLLADREYEASVWARWPDGPEKAPREGQRDLGPSVRHSLLLGAAQGSDRRLRRQGRLAVRSPVDQADVSLSRHRSQGEDAGVRVALAEPDSARHHRVD